MLRQTNSTCQIKKGFPSMIGCQQVLNSGDLLWLCPKAKIPNVCERRGCRRHYKKLEVDDRQRPRKESLAKVEVEMRSNGWPSKHELPKSGVENLDMRANE